MDKFTAKAGGGGVNGGAVKRTKIVQKTKTYMEGGYMKTVNEEVEVTDDEEEQPLKPAQTNKTRSIPHPDPKKAKTGAENKTAEGGGGGGSKGGGKAKKAVPKKQASMMSFFKKA
eukprot:jgi/Undpi1/8795/HiC_scaffold_25.g11257.m1